MVAGMPMKKPSVWQGGISPLRISYGKLMMWFFLLSDAFTFTALLAAYGFIRWQHAAFTGPVKDFVASQAYWPIPEKVFNAVPFLHHLHLPLVFVGIMTFILILSSVTMVLAVEAGHRQDKNSVQQWMLWTIVGGITFLACQAWEWNHFIQGTAQGTCIKTFANGQWTSTSIFGAHLFINEYGPPVFAALFFFITGFHGMHVLSGVVINIIIFYNTAIGTYEQRGSYEMVEKVGLYWHFIDLVWVFVFTFFYLI